MAQQNHQINQDRRLKPLPTHLKSPTAKYHHQPQSSSTQNPNHHHHHHLWIESIAKLTKISTWNPLSHHLVTHGDQWLSHKNDVRELVGTLPKKKKSQYIIEVHVSFGSRLLYKNAKNIINFFLYIKLTNWCVTNKKNLTFNY